MTVDGWTSAVRHQLGLGRLLPLGGPRDGAWITEAAAEAVLRRAVRDVGGVRLGALRLGPADPEGGSESVVPAPPSALAPGPLRVTAECAATASEPLPTAVARLRDALAAAATERLGLVVSEVDLRVTELLDDEPGTEPERSAAPVPGGPALVGDEAFAAAAALSVPGVTGTSGVLGRAVRVEERQDASAALPRRHARVEITVSADRRTVDVARAVRGTVSETLPDHPTVAVLVTAVD
ncbi:nucleopolyhedrovirus P10 family protein [Streptomyces sp. NBC_01235]|uniref:nucleopolyhedrovirus P10 family protein n=1 Tax=Streptomyces sp. NBC_01235 TaxID=2903788 RepID=UPI002E129343|nr:nucleopolyhedrovirus P10 family protein [Streptomyces sp. NBC_01235]